MKQYYWNADSLPKEIFRSQPIDDAVAVQQWLSDKRGESVLIVQPTEGEEAKLVRLSESNATFLLGELKLQKMKRADYVPHAVKSLQRDLRLAALPRRIECFDNSNIHGSDPVAYMVVFVDGKQKKSEYR